MMSKQNTQDCHIFLNIQFNKIITNYHILLNPFGATPCVEVICHGYLGGKLPPIFWKI